MRYAETVDLRGGAELLVRNAVTQGSRNTGAIPGGCRSASAGYQELVYMRLEL